MIAWASIGPDGNRCIVEIEGMPREDGEFIATNGHTYPQEDWHTRRADAQRRAREAIHASITAARDHIDRQTAILLQL